jgi:site-specific DNA-methyltransferase (adenine-specific)
MGKSWDGGDVAFRSETWRGFWKLLYPGAFGMTFGGSRTSHRMAVAIEDAGFIIHPMIGWVYGSGFPKATRVKTGEEIETGETEELSDIRSGHMHTGRDTSKVYVRSKKKSYGMQKTWEGHRYGLQAMKPALEPIIVFQKPYAGKPVDDITRTGAGALWIDGGRIGRTTGDRTEYGRDKLLDYPHESTSLGKFNQNSPYIPDKSGRWPANFIIQHSLECKQVGTSPDGYIINRFVNGAKPFGDAVGEKYEGAEVGGESAVWQCVDGCPARELDRQSGQSSSNAQIMQSDPENDGRGTWQMSPRKNAQIRGHNDSGGASRFFFQADWRLEQTAPFVYRAKAGNSERETGLIHHIACAKCGKLHSTHHLNDKKEYESCRRCIHPTIKPLSLTKHLATLLLPPKEYAPRRMLVPFAGTGSEMIGAQQAGWECVIGIEKETEYVNTAKARIDHWQKQGVQLDLFSQ